MGFIIEIKKHVEELKIQIMHGEGKGKGNLPGIVLKGLKEKKQVLEEVLIVFKKYENPPIS